MKKQTIWRIGAGAMAAIGIAATGIGASAAVTGAYPTVEGASGASDSTKLYADEIMRKELLAHTKVIYLSNKKDNEPEVDNDSIESLIARFYSDQFRNSRDPEAPYFMFMSRDANLAMGIGGVMNVEGWFDWNGSIPGGKFTTYNIPMMKTPENWRSLGASASGTNLFFTIIGRNTKIGDFMAYIQGGFNGYGNSGFKLKKAWLQWRDFQVGLAPTTFSDPAAQPDVLDPEGSNGKLTRTNVLLRYMHTWKGRWTVAGSVEFPNSQPDVDDKLTSKCNDYVPDIAAFGQYQWDRGLSHVRVGGIIRTMTYQDLVTDRTHHQTGWGAMLSTVVQAGRMLQFTGQASVGQGISAYTGDLSNGNYDLLAIPDEAGRLYAPFVWSATVGVKATWMNNLTSTVALGTLRNFTKDGAPGDAYHYGQYLAVNTIYKFTPRLQVGLEYLAGKRKNVNGDHSNANRLMALLTVSF